MIALLAALPDWYQWLGLGAAGIIVVFLVAAACWRLWYELNLRAIRKRSAEFEVTDSGRPSDLPRGFGYKIAWLAISADAPESVAEMLDYHCDVQSMNWTEGIAAAYSGDHVFVTPAVQGWVFAVGFDVWPRDPHHLLPLSVRFGKALGFASHRVSSAYAWAKAVEGDMQRWFDIGDSEILANEGEVTPVERNLGLSWDNLEALCLEVDEEHVLQVAGGWSINPMELDYLDEPRVNGLVCRIRK